MKKSNILLTIFTVVIFLFATACGGSKTNNNEKGDETSNDSPIVGKWTIVKAEGSSASMNEGMVYLFNNDGTAKVGEGGLSSEYKYTFEDNKLSMDYNGEGKIVLEFSVKFEGDSKMTMDNISSDQKFWLEK